LPRIGTMNPNSMEGEHADTFWSARTGPAPDTHLFVLNKLRDFRQNGRMIEPIIVSGREFRPEVVEHLNELAGQQPAPTRQRLAREACALLAWQGSDGRPALASAKVALRKLQPRGAVPQSGLQGVELGADALACGLAGALRSSATVGRDLCGSRPLHGAVF